MAGHLLWLRQPLREGSLPWRTMNRSASMADLRAPLADTLNTEWQESGSLTADAHGPHRNNRAARGFDLPRSKPGHHSDGHECARGTADTLAMRIGEIGPSTDLCQMSGVTSGEFEMRRLRMNYLIEVSCNVIPPPGYS
jgi:hypothetical protein